MPHLPSRTTLLSVLALLGASAVLVADSTNDCEVYEAFDVTYTYSTNCFPDETGTLRLMAAEKRKTPPIAKDVQANATTKAIAIQLVSVDYAGESCSSGDEGRGRFFSATLALSAPDSAGSDGVTCTGWRDGVVNQALSCVGTGASGGSQDGGAAACTMTLTRVQ